MFSSLLFVAATGKLALYYIEASSSKALLRVGRTSVLTLTCVVVRSLEVVT